MQLLQLAGDIDENDVFSSVEKHFARFKNTKEIPQNIHTVEPKQDGKKSSYKKDSAVQMIAITYQIPF